MEFKINYIIKAEVFDKIKQEKIYFTKEDSKIIEEIPEIIYDNNHLLGSGSIYEFLDFQIELYAKEQGQSIDNYRVDFFEVTSNSDEYDVFFAHPENKNEFTLTPDLYVFIKELKIEMLTTPTLSGELLTNTSIKWSFDIPEEYIKNCGHYIYDSEDNIIAQLPIDINYYIESSLSPLTNYTRKVKRYTPTLISDVSDPITITTKIDDVNSSTDKLIPFEKDWYNETNYEEKTVNRLKAFESGIGEGNDLKLLGLDINLFNKNLDIKYKLLGTKNEMKYKSLPVKVIIKAINRHTQIVNEVRHSDGSIHEQIQVGFYESTFFTKNINDFEENTATLGYRKKDAYDYDSFEEFKEGINEELVGDKLLDTDVPVDSLKYDEVSYDSIDFSFIVNDGSFKEEELELHYKTANGDFIKLNYFDRDRNKSFEMFIKDKVIDGIIPIENEIGIISSYSEMEKEDDDFSDKYSFSSIEQLSKRIYIEYNEKELVAIGAWESEEIKADIHSIDYENKTIEYKIMSTDLIGYDLKANHIIQPLYLTRYIDNYNFKFDKFLKQSIKFDDDYKTLKETFSFQKTINPMNPILNKGIYYLNNLEMYKYNNHELKLNKAISSFETKNNSVLIEYRITINGESYDHKIVIGKEIIYNGEIQSISNYKTVQELIEADLTELENTSYDELELINVTSLNDETLIEEITLFTGIDIEPRVIGKTYDYNNIIDVVDNKYTINSFEGIEQEKVIIRKGGVALDRIYNKEDETSLDFSFNRKGINKRSYQLPHINIDETTLKIYLNNEETENYTLFNNNLLFDEIITQEQVIETSYRIKDSYVIYEENEQYIMKFNTDLLGEFELYYEKSDTPEPIDYISLNPLFSGMTEGYLYIDDDKENVKRFEVYINDSNLKFENSEITFGKIIAIDEYGNRCPDIKVFSDVERGEIKYLNGDITNENGIVSFLYTPPTEMCEDTIIVTHPDINEIKKVIINVQ